MENENTGSHTFDFNQYFQGEQADDAKLFAWALDAEDFYEKGPSYAGQDETYTIAQPLLDDFFSSIDERVNGGSTVATFRFAHAETMMPFAALLGLPGSIQQAAASTTDVYTYANNEWRGESVTPMAANVQWDVAVKSGNACILRGGSEAFETNRILGELVQQALTETGLPTEAVHIAPTTDRDFVGEMIRANKYVDVIIPRGGKGLIARLAAEATVPMIHHLDGICHTYVDKDADIDMAVSVTDNAKTQRYSPCNATETLLVHEAVADVFLPRIGRIFAEKNVEMRCDAKSKACLLYTSPSPRD